MIVIGIGEDGHKKVLHFTIENKNTSHWGEVLQSLIQRGLNTKSICLVTTDGATTGNNCTVFQVPRENLQGHLHKQYDRGLSPASAQGTKNKWRLPQQ